MAPKKRRPIKDSKETKNNVNNEENENNSKLKSNKKQQLNRTKSKEPKQSIYEAISAPLKALSALITISSVAIYFTIHSSSNEIANRTTESSILHEYAEMVLEFYEAQQKMVRALNEEPLADLIQLQLRPIEQRVAALSLHTSQYEKKMEKSTELRNNFISSTMTELETFTDEIISLDSKVKTILEESNFRKEALRNSSENTINSEKRIQAMYNSKSKYIFDVLKQQGVDLFPIDTEKQDWDPENLKTSKTEAKLKKAGISPKKLSEKLETLSKLMGRRTQLHNKMLDACIALGAYSLKAAGDDPVKFQKLMDDPDLAPVFEEYGVVGKKIEEIIKKDVTFINLTVKWILEASYVTGNMMRGFLESEIDKEPYVQVRNIIMTDINNLKTMVDNLRYSR